MNVFNPRFITVRTDAKLYSEGPHMGDELIGGELNEGIIVEIVGFMELSEREKWDYYLKRVNCKVCATFNDLRRKRENCEGCIKFSRCPVDEQIKMYP